MRAGGYDITLAALCLLHIPNFYKHLSVQQFCCPIATKMNCPFLFFIIKEQLFVDHHQSHKFRWLFKFSSVFATFHSGCSVTAQEHDYMQFPCSSVLHSVS
eukprot:scpid49615/ scgid21914/ 